MPTWMAPLLVAAGMGFAYLHMLGAVLVGRAIRGREDYPRHPKSEGGIE